MIHSLHKNVARERQFITMKRMIYNPNLCKMQSLHTNALTQWHQLVPNDVEELLLLHCKSQLIAHARNLQWAKFCMSGKFVNGNPLASKECKMSLLWTAFFLLIVNNNNTITKARMEGHRLQIWEGRTLVQRPAVDATPNHVQIWTLSRTTSSCAPSQESKQTHRSTATCSPTRVVCPCPGAEPDLVTSRSSLNFFFYNFFVGFRSYVSGWSLGYSESGSTLPVSLTLSAAHKDHRVSWMLQISRWLELCVPFTLRVSSSNACMHGLPFLFLQ